MQKFVAATMIAGVCFLAASCKVEIEDNGKEVKAPVAQEVPKPVKRTFVKSSNEYSVSEILDTRTGVRYLVVENYYGLSVTPILDETGRPAKL